MAPAAIPPGWYDDGLGSMRWWDGGAWTDQAYARQPANGSAPGVAEGIPAATLPGSTATATRPVVASAPPSPSGDGVLSLVLGLVLLVAAGYALLTVGVLFGLVLLVGIGLLVRAGAEFRGEQPPWGLAGKVLPRGPVRLGLVVAGLLLIMFGISAARWLADFVAPAEVVPPPAAAAPITVVNWPLGYLVGDGYAYLPGKDGDAAQCPTALPCRVVSVVTATDCSTATIFAEYTTKAGSPVRLQPVLLRGPTALRPTTVLITAPRGSDIQITRVICRT